MPQPRQATDAPVTRIKPLLLLLPLAMMMMMMKADGGKSDNQCQAKAEFCCGEAKVFFKFRRLSSNATVCSDKGAIKPIEKEESLLPLLFYVAPNLI